MAARETSKRPPSPPEHYNPLEEFILNESHDQSSDSDKSSSNWTDADDFGESTFLYAKSPPIPRQRIREKEKSKNLRLVTKDFFGNDKRQLIIASNGAENSEEAMNSPSLSSGDISKNNLFSRKRTEAIRSVKTLRGLDRDEKRFVPSLVLQDQGQNGPSSMEYESHNRFLSLDSRPSVRKPIASFLNTIISQVPSRKHTTMKECKCPKDRLEFYNTFSMLVNLGSTKREKPKEIKLVPYTRQGSNEQELWTNQCSDLIWLGLQAYLSNRTLNQQDEHLFCQRDIVTSVLDEVVSFQCKLLNRDKSERDPEHCWLQRTVTEQRQALEQVSDILTRLDSVERLYPTRKALGRQHPVYMSDEFQFRLDAMQMWNSIVHELNYKLEVMAQVLLVDTLGNVCWPGLLTNQETVHIVCTQSNGYSALVDCSFGDGDDSKSCDSLEHTSFCVSLDPVPARSSLRGQREPVCNGEFQKTDKKNVCFDISGQLPVRSSSFESSDTNDSFYISTPIKAGRPLGTYNLASSSAVFDVNSRTSVYRHFVERSLKRSGVRKLLLLLRNLLENTLHRTRLALIGNDINGCSYNVQHITTVLKSERHSIIDLNLLSSSPSVEHLASVPLLASDRPKVPFPCSNSRWQSEFGAMNLPFFTPAFLFLCRIPLDVVHECLRLWLEQRPKTEPSLLCLRQLIHECREVLMSAVIAKKWYQDNVAGIQHNDFEMGGPFFDTEQFEEDIEQMLEVYFNYVELMMAGLQNLPEMPKMLKNILEEEWKFTKYVCPYIRNGESNAGNKFSVIGTNLLNSISDFLHSDIDDCSSVLYDSLRDNSCHGDLRQQDTLKPRQAMLQTCRNFKEHFREARERALKALSLVKMLKKDLEVATLYGVTGTMKEFLEQLAATGHIKVEPFANGNVIDTLMFIPAPVGDHMSVITNLMNTIHISDSTVASDGGDPTEEACYLVLLRTTAINELEADWHGPVRNFQLEAETAQTLSHLQLDCVMLMATQSAQLAYQRMQFEKLLSHGVRLVQEQTSCHQSIAESLYELKKTALELRDYIVDAISDVERRLSFADETDADDHDKMNKHLRENIIQCYNFGFEYHKELIRLVSGEMRMQLLPKLVDFVKQWIKFVLEKCDRGRGLRPRWANQGLDFLIIACDPEVLAILKEDDYKELQQRISECIMHVIGEKTSVSSSSRLSSPDSGLQRRPFKPSLSVPDANRVFSRTTSAASSSGHSVQSEPITNYASHRLHPSSSNSSNLTGSNVLLDMEDVNDDFRDAESAGELDKQVTSPEQEPHRLSRQQTIMARIEQLEIEHDHYLKSVRAIGRVVNSPMPSFTSANYRRVNFRWQRGTKIGEGQFGKVYTAIRMDTGELMAMKQIRLQPNDVQTTKEIVDEIQIFETISHPSLVKYYGVELHKDELLIFMECCSNGTVQDAAKLGLTEALIRKYTSEILVAINVLHEKRIVHRDLKGANIFLSQNGPLKLGDFGSAVQLKNHTTLPGELSSMAGTTAYMAPEVFTHTSKVGRAADIWSLGCVLIEMVTGKRPWPDMDNQHAIMFKVGTGGVPPTPERLSKEGRDFLSHCLQVDPRKRWTTGQLLNHAFVKVFIDDVDGQT